MKAISLPQPWATLLALGEKQFHFVNWNPSAAEGRIAIHALDDRGQANVEASRQDPIFGLLQKHGLDFDKLPFGQVIATAEIQAVHHSGFIVRTLSRQERKLNNKHYTHTYAIQFRDIQPLPLPIAAKGGAQFWEWSEPVTEVTTEVPLVAEAEPEEAAPKRTRKRETERENE